MNDPVVGTVLSDDDERFLFVLWGGYDSIADYMSIQVFDAFSAGYPVLFERQFSGELRLLFRPKFTVPYQRLSVIGVS